MTTTHKILIVEDHKPLRSLLSFLLLGAGYETCETADAKSALDEAGRQQPHLVLLDRQLPDMDGIEVLRCWRANAATAWMPVIILSGRADQVDRVSGLTAGDRQIHVGPIEFRMLNLFMTNPNRVLTRSQIVNRVWRINARVDERTVDVHVRRLRLALEPTGHDRCVQTVRGVGYRLARNAEAGAANAV